ncbi:MAG: PQQ-binding-like beta-propeller repeat protein [Phycisphaerae bacterium]|nr:PQQ-binding-like beta-propeller repeat protein [Saprospiraceae bacterium]
MCHNLMTAVLIVSTSLSVSAQRTADWSVELAGNAQKIVIQDFTGIPIIQTESSFIGVDPETRKVAWTAKRASSKLVAAMEEGTDFYSVNMTPYVLVRENLIDSRNGQVLMDKDRDGYKEVGGYEVIPELNSVIVLTIAKGMVRIYLVSIADNKVLWNTDLMKNSIIESVDMTPQGQAAAEANDDGDIEIPVGTSLVSPDGYLFYRHKRNFFCLKSTTGKVLWTEKTAAAELLLSPDGKTLLVAEAEAGPAIEGAVSRPKGKKVSAYNIATGKPAWKEEVKAGAAIRWLDAHPKFLAIVHRKGCNLYQYSTGEPLWKNDFEGRRIVEVLPNEEGYLITYESGYKAMQVGKDGVSRWKKPQLIETEEGEENGDDTPDESGIDRFHFAKGDVLVAADRIRFVPAKGSGLKRWKMKLSPSDRISYDPVRHNLLVLTLEKLLLLNPDKNPKVALDLKVNLKDPYAFDLFEVREKVYFMSSEKEYVILDPESAVATHKFYPKAFDPTGLLFRAAFAGLASAGLTVREDYSGTRAVRWGKPGYCNLEANNSKSEKASADAIGTVFSLMPPSRFNAFKSGRDFAYYLTDQEVSGKGKNVLIKVSKDLGGEADKLVFDSARPLYQVDEIQKKVFYVNKNTLKVFQM